MKATVATLFATLFAVSMPVHAEWKTHTQLDDKGGTILKRIYVSHIHESSPISLSIVCPIPIIGNNYGVYKRIFENHYKGIFPYGRNGEVIAIEFDGDISRSGYNLYQSTPLLVQFDNEPEYFVHVRFSRGLLFSEGLLLIIPDKFGHYFKLNLENHKILCMEINIPGDSIVARFDLTGFKETYDSYCD